MDKDIFIKHLEFIQSNITRMAANSFLLKGWNVTITAGLFALAAKDANTAYVVIALFTGLSFWGLDAYYLRQERLFRRLYDEVRKGFNNQSTLIEVFSLSTVPYQSQVAGWFRTLWTPSIIGVHGLTVLLIIAATLVRFLS